MTYGGGGGTTRQASIRLASRAEAPQLVRSTLIRAPLKARVRPVARPTTIVRPPTATRAGIEETP